MKWWSMFLYVYVEFCLVVKEVEIHSMHVELEICEMILASAMMIFIAFNVSNPAYTSCEVVGSYR